MNKVQLYAPISKTDDEQHMVYGYASTEALDSQGEIVKIEALTKALDGYMKFANIREMHQPSAVGKTKKAQIDKNGMYIAAKVVDKNAWEKVKEGVYNGFSIGGRVMEMVDNEIVDLTLSEISLVDRPANPEAIFDVWKGEGLETKKSLYEVCDLSVLIEQLGQLEDVAEMQGNTARADKMTASIKGLLAILKEEVKTEGDKIVSEEDSEPVVMADTKEDIKKDEQVVATQDKQPVPIEGIVEVEADKEQPVTDEGKIVEPVEEVKEEPKEIEEEPKKEVKEEPEKTVEPKEEVKVPIEDIPQEDKKDIVEEPVVESTPKEVVEEKISSWQMPTGEELTKYLEAEGVTVDERVISTVKNKLAGKILTLVEKSMADDKNKQMAASYYAKIAKDTAGKELKDLKSFDKVAVLIKRFEGLISKDVTPEENDKSGEVEKLKALVALISSFNEGHALSEQDMKALKDGLAFASERFGGGHIEEPIKDNNVHAMDNPEMQKIESEVQMLKAEIEKLRDVPEPVKVKASYQVIEKFDANNADELKKAELEVEQVSGELKANPNDIGLQKKAQELSARVMKLRRTSN